MATFEVIPAIDLKDGRCVRLLRGERDRETVYDDDPVAVADRWVRRGARRIHVVDLDGAFSGAAGNRAAVERILAGSEVPVQVGGGLRDRAAVDAVLAAGARWAIVGTRAIEDPDFLDELMGAHGHRIIVSVDVRNDAVALRGWTESGGSLDRLLERLKGQGVQGLIVTDVTRDGTLEGPNAELLDHVAGAGFRVLAAGGIGSVEDLEQVAGVEGVDGAIVGRALYTGDVDLKAALNRFSAAGEDR